GGLEDDVELVLLLLGGSGVAATRGTRGGDRDGSSGGHVEDLLELLDELGELDEGELLESLDELVVAELRHDDVPSCSGSDVPGAYGRRGLRQVLQVLRMGGGTVFSAD